MFGRRIKVYYDVTIVDSVVLNEKFLVYESIYFCVIEPQYTQLLVKTLIKSKKLPFYKVYLFKHNIF